MRVLRIKWLLICFMCVSILSTFVPIAPRVHSATPDALPTATTALPDIVQLLATVEPVTVARGTSIGDIVSLLPTEAEVLLDDNSRRTVHVWWDTSAIAVPAGDGAQTFPIIGTVNSDQPTGKPPEFTNSNNLALETTITYASIADSSTIIRSVPYIPVPYELERQPNPTVESLGLPEQAEVILGSGNSVTASVYWNITVQPDSYKATGNLSNLPVGVVNPGFKMKSFISTYERTDIRDVPYLNLTTNHGAPKTAQGFGLPEQIMVTLYNGEKWNLPVTWLMDNVAYDPSIQTMQWVYVSGQFDSLPPGATNSRKRMAFAQVQVAANPNNLEISGSPAQITSRVSVGAEKTVAGLGLPAQVNVPLSNGTRINVDVNWRLEWVGYDPTSTAAQSFYVTGNFTNLPVGVFNSNGYNVFALVITQARYITGFDYLYREFDNGAPKTVEGLQLPAQVEAWLNDGSRLLLGVDWNVASAPYNPDSRMEQSFTVYGSATQLPSGVTNMYNYRPQAYVYVAADPNVKYFADRLRSVNATVDNGVPATVAGFGLPAQVEVDLTDGSSVNIDVEWDVPGPYAPVYDPSNPLEQNLLIKGTYVNLPDGVVNTSYSYLWAHVKVKKAIPKEIVDTGNYLRIRLPYGTPKSLDSLELPSTVEVVLSDNSKRTLSVEWESEWWDGLDNYDPSSPDYQSFYVHGKFVNLPSGIYNSQGLRKHAFIEIFSHPSVTEVLEVPRKEIALTHEFELPDQVEVLLTNGVTTMKNVYWRPEYYSGNYSIQIFDHFKGFLKNTDGSLDYDRTFYLLFEQGKAVYQRLTFMETHMAQPMRHLKRLNDNYSDLYEGALPSQLQAELTDGSFIGVNMCWYRGETNLPRYNILGVPCGEFPEGVDNGDDVYYYGNIVPGEPEETEMQVADVQTFNEIMSLNDLPKQVAVSLTNGNTIMAPVNWNAVNLELLDDDEIAVAEGALYGLPSGVTNPDGKKSLAYIHKSITDLFYDFDIDKNHSTVNEQARNVRFVDSDGIIRIHVTSYDHPIQSATAAYNGKTIPLERISNNEFVAEWEPDASDRGLGVTMPNTAEGLEELKGSAVQGSFHALQVTIVPLAGTERSISKQVYVALQNEHDFKSEVTNLPIPRIVSPADAMYNCLAFALDKTDQYLWYWYNEGFTAPINPNHDEVIARLDIAGYERTFDLNEAAIIAFGSNGQIYHFAKYDPLSGFVTSKDAFKEVVVYEGVPEYSDEYGTAQLYFKKK